MSKNENPRICGQNIIVKIPHDLLKEVNELWPKAQCFSRNEFIRRALWAEVFRTKAVLAGGPS